MESRLRNPVVPSRPVPWRRDMLPVAAGQDRTPLRATGRAIRPETAGTGAEANPAAPGGLWPL